MMKKMIDIRKALGAGSALALVITTGSALAAAPNSFDGFTVNVTATNAAIDTTADPLCAGGSCSPLVSGDGFLQESVKDTATGTTYIRTIITDSGATLTAAGLSGNTAATALPYTDESFVRQDQTAGILSQQRSSESTAANTTTDVGATSFSSNAKLAMGWAQGTILAGQTTALRDVNITQNLVDEGVNSVAGDTFTNDFSLANTRNASGNVTGQSMSIRQDVKMATATTTTPTDVQSFVVEQRKGTDVGTAGSITLGQATGSINPSASTGGTLNYSAGEDIMLTWIGQTINTANAGATATLSKFGFEGVTNKTTPATVSTFSTIDTGLQVGGSDVAPFAWDTVFGATGPTVAPLP